jgi:hypothetical protein
VSLKSSRLEEVVVQVVLSLQRSIGVVILLQVVEVVHHNSLVQTVLKGVGIGILSLIPLIPFQLNDM